MDWIDLAKDKERWRTFVNGVKTFGFREMQGIY
jgi:hypothetical protein